MKIVGHEMWSYRKIGQIPWTGKQTNKNLRLKITIMKNERSKQLKYFSHIKRHTKVKIILAGEVEGKKRAKDDNDTNGKTRRGTVWQGVMLK